MIQKECEKEILGIVNLKSKQDNDDNNKNKINKEDYFKILGKKY